MWRVAKVLKDASFGSLNRSSSCLWSCVRHESGTSKDSDVKAEVPYKTLQVRIVLKLLKQYRDCFYQC